ncbi:helix-turn-helix domain-containing protein [Salimicrobium humidisoli]|uniref:helix-turn-helix domain-containing protein n=1 Tax=Salimicrobium humidisoli TaxID=2029857 RepID=UPI0013040B02|nr:helix-turn-helix transcriptional regulator [Salimicrobium humidisoli]
MTVKELRQLKAEKERAEQAGLSRNQLAVEGRIRPATLSDLVNGKVKSVSFATIIRIVETLDKLDSSRKHNVEDIFVVAEEAEEDVE